MSTEKQVPPKTAPARTRWSFVDDDERMPMRNGKVRWHRDKEHVRHMAQGVGTQLVGFNAGGYEVAREPLDE